MKPVIYLLKTGLTHFPGPTYILRIEDAYSRREVNVLWRSQRYHTGKRESSWLWSRVSKLGVKLPYLHLWDEESNHSIIS